ncbi:ribosomal protection-like ABC-F family protein [Ottowia thiooxydans]|uniref:ribosomal protection-like ABC-F family protein n=1 Tax=Ottowia thiooxydans TaxID=219182 RepID=UPI0004000712|nr:ATP-binding cassette domain-containing protein [Ottowia thiooxydans]
MISLLNLTLRRGVKVLLDGANATIHPGEKVALVGRNGAGKSTLFGLLNGTLHEDAGDFSMPASWRLAQVAQDMPETTETATDFVLAGDTRLMELREQLADAERRVEEDPDDVDAGMAIGQAHSDLHDAGAHDATARAQALTLGLGFKVSELDLPVNSFSGGWRMRLQLARALMAPSDLLLLDEPTNHLDLDALVWLEAWLARYPGTMIVISHDREFLDAVTTVTVHIENARLTRYGGNYSAFEELRAQQLSLQQAAFSKQQEKVAHLQKFIDRFKAKASKAKQAQSRVKALERMEKIAPVLADAEFQFEFKEPGNIPNPMLAIRDAVFGYRAPEASEESQLQASAEPSERADLPEYATSQSLHAELAARGDLPPEPAAGDRIILPGVTRTVLAGQRIGILGANGQGKSTLVKTIARAMPLLGGTLTEGKGLSIGYFAQQELDVLRPADTPLEHMVRLARETGQANTEGAREQQLRNFLGTFSFPGPMVVQKVGQFSGGEKARLVLAMIVWQRPNLLLLDEPTNHLDLATREALAMALNEFEGTVMLVSHDRALLRSVCDEFWLVARGNISDFEGDLDDYQRYLLDESKRLREEAREIAASAATSGTAGAVSSPRTEEIIAPASNVKQAEATNSPAGGAERRKQAAQRRQALATQLRPHKKTLTDAETRMSGLQKEKSELQERLTSPLSPSELAEAGRRLKSIEDALATAEETWLAAGEAIDKIESEEIAE